MTAQDLISSLTADRISLVSLVIFVLFTVVQVSPIKINPWDAVLGWIGGKVNKNLTKRIEEVEEKLDKHIEASEKERVRKVRTDILSFANSCMNHTKHTREEFDFVISECDQYEQHIKETGQPNGVAEAGIRYIRGLYDKCIEENSFLVARYTGGESDV